MRGGKEEEEAPSKALRNFHGDAFAHTLFVRPIERPQNNFNVPSVIHNSTDDVEILVAMFFVSICDMKATTRKQIPFHVTHGY